MFRRIIKPNKNKSFFLFGPRQTGKSTYVKGLLDTKDVYVDLLPQRTFLKYAKEPGRLRDELLTHLKKNPSFTCTIDEIQKIPSLLDEVHELVESTNIRFIMTGSSSRKLKRSGINLLAGRAYNYHLFGLTADEMGDEFDLERALRIGTLPTLWKDDQEDEKEFLRSYVETYLKEEIAQEGLVRQIAPFAAFLDIAAACDGETLNFSNIARECGVSVKTAQQYYQILEDTFLAYRIEAWNRSPRKRLVLHPRYYLFDTGVTNALTHHLTDTLDLQTRGRRFEQFFLSSLLATIHYSRKDLKVHYWRTKDGAEVDFLICRGFQILAALEVKSTYHPAKEPMNGIRSFSSDHPNVPVFLIGIDQADRTLSNKVKVRCWDRFLKNDLPEIGTSK